MTRSKEWTTMVIRSWEGTARSGSGDEYFAYLTEVMIPKILSIAGCLGVQVLRRVGDPDRFVVQSQWSDVEAIRRFAGPDPEHAVVPPEARALLAAFDDRARHFDVPLDLAPGASG